MVSVRLLLQGRKKNKIKNGTELTLWKPIASACSRKAWRDMFSPYLRITPAFFLSPVTRL